MGKKTTSKTSKKKAQERAHQNMIKAFHRAKTHPLPIHSQKDYEALKNAIDTCPDFINSPRHKNSLTVFLKKEKPVIAQETICKILLLTPKELNEKIVGIITKIQRHFKLPSIVLNNLKDLFFPPSKKTIDKA